jgi:hypothetical protein
MNKHFRFSGSTLQRFEELGVRAPAVLRRAGLPQAFIQQARALLNTEELFALWRAVGEVSTDPSIRLLLGTETKTERFSPNRSRRSLVRELRLSHRPNGSL